MRLDTKGIIVSLLVFLFLGEVQARPFGLPEGVTVYHVLLLLLVLGAVAALHFRGKLTAPIEVVSLAYDKEKHKIELTVRNNSSRQYCMKSALRLVQLPEQYVKENASEDSIPLAPAKMSTMERKLYQLLCEDENALVINPQETKTLSYDILIPKDNVNINPEQNIEVSISYGEDIGSAPSSYNPPAEDTFEQQIEEGLGVGAMQNDSTTQVDSAVTITDGDEISELLLLEELLEATKKAPPESIELHMKEQNDFSIWVNNVVRNIELANRLSEISYTTPEETKNRVIEVIDSRIGVLKHPYLRKVSKEKPFVLKLDHSKQIGAVFHLEELLGEIRKAPAEAIKFHTRDGNDFSVWINDAVGDKKLAEEIGKIDYSNSEAKKALEEKLETRIQELKKI